LIELGRESNFVARNDPALSDDSPIKPARDQKTAFSEAR
jgi:hypothetical protein